MRTGGRVNCAGAAVVSSLLYLFTSIEFASSSDYGVPIEIKIWDTGRTPLAHMVDVTNSFGLKVLAEHNFLNDNNIAFSPYGLMGILVALYEGIDGESSYQIQRAMSLPWNRNVMRVGFRDIHRTLKTYFVPEEGFLAGLALNNENVTFNEGYKKILRFYGFDLDNNEQLPTLAPTNGTGTNETTTVAPSADATVAADSSTTMAPTTREETTPNSNAETLNDVDIRGPTTPAPSTASNAESSTVMTPPSSERATEQVSIGTQTMETQTDASVTTSTTVPSTAEETTSPSTTTAQSDTEFVSLQSSSTVALSEEPTANNEVDTTSAMPSTAESIVATTTVTAISTGETASTTEGLASTMFESQATDITETTSPDVTTMGSRSELETLERRKKSIVDFIYSNPPYVDDYLIHRSYDIPIPAGPDPTNPFEGNQMFLVNGLRNVQVTYMHYDTVLEHAYLPHLEASALRLPLDSERYYLLVILPTRGGATELGRLLARMARESDLSDVCGALRPRRVRAIVPSFTVKGHVTLTTDLQKLGIRDVFEPRQRDFTPMTHQAGVYVRSIEQAVSVAIRKYRETDANTSSRYVTNRHPVTFSATYPFLYFVMDSSIHVSLMAGKMVDPLNSRIL